MSNGYEAVAEEFMRVRSSTTGLAIITKWASHLPNGASVLDVGAGSGEPLTAALLEAGLEVFALDASPKMVSAFRRRFPNVTVACEPVETSHFFNHRFDGILAVGLIFLLGEIEQGQLINRLAAALKPGGELLFSAPSQTGVWEDVLTGRQSTSLGAEAYRACLAKAGLTLIGEHIDEGGSHYYQSGKPA